MRRKQSAREAKEGWLLLASSLEAQRDMARYAPELVDPHLEVKLLYCRYKVSGLEPDADLKLRLRRLGGEEAD